MFVFAFGELQQDSELVLGHLLRNTACMCFTFLAVNIMALRERHLSTTASRTVVAVNSWSRERGVGASAVLVSLALAIGRSPCASPMSRTAPVLGHAHYFSEVFVFGALQVGAVACELATTAADSPVSLSSCPRSRPHQPLVMATMFIFMIVDLRQTWHIYSGHDKRSS